MSVRLDHESFDMQGQCPICWSMNLDYDDAHIDDWNVYYDWICNKCKSTWTERYTMDFYSQHVDYDGIQNKDTVDEDRERDKATRANGN